MVDRARMSWTLRLAALLLAIAAGPGCQALQQALAETPKPTARLRGVGVEELSLEHARLALDVEVSNPYTIPLPLADLDYDLSAAGSTFVSGRAALASIIPAGTSATVTVPADVSFSGLLGALDGIRPGDVVDYVVDATLSADAPGIGRAAIPLRKEGTLPIPAVPEIELAAIDWTTVSADRVTATLLLRITNVNGFPADLETLSYALALGGTPIVETSVAQPVSFDPQTARELEVPISLRPLDLGLAALQIIGGESAAYRLGGVMSFDTPFGPIAFPYERAGTTVFKR